MLLKDLCAPGSISFDGRHSQMLPLSETETAIPWFLVQAGSAPLDRNRINHSYLYHTRLVIRLAQNLAMCYIVRTIRPAEPVLGRGLISKSKFKPMAHTKT